MSLRASAQNALTFAYQYGYPLYAYAEMVQGTPHAKPNTLYRGTTLATAADRHLVRPNVDTLYSVIFYDLSQHDLEFTVPKFEEDRYWCFPFYDLYGNNFGNVSSLQRWPAGKYLLRFDQSHLSFGVEKCDEEKREDGYVAYVNSPTPYGLALIRVLVRDREEDMANVIQRRTEIRFQEVSKHSRHNECPPLDLDSLVEIINNTKISQADAVLQLLAKLANHNQSEVISDRSWISNMLIEAGISNSTFTQPLDTDMVLAVQMADASSINLRRLAGMTDNLGNGWTKTADHILGDYRSFYNARHIIAKRGYLALTCDQVFYPVYTADNPSVAYEYDIGPQQAYLVTFSSRPKMKPTGFWSMTAYDGNGFLIPSRLHRYAFGDRSNLKYTDGARIYENDGQPCARDGSFQILLQPADVEPGEQWLSNWLPAPAGGGKFSFSMRFYGAMDCMSNGEWIYPTVEKVDAFVG